MSEELQDEVEAINSIYGEGCLTTIDPPGLFVLALPQGASVLRLGFPTAYPSEAPQILGSQHSSGGVKGAGARDLALFKAAVTSVFQEGNVCLYDALEEFERRKADDDETSEEPITSLDDGNDGKKSENDQNEEIQDVADMLVDPPSWVVSDPIVENKSTFVAHVAAVSSAEQARQYLQHLLASDKRIRSATHNISAWRIRGPTALGTNSNSSTTGPPSSSSSTAVAAITSYQDCDDDGETAAGGRLLHLMQVMEVWGAMVVVTRWYGGVKLGPRRFAVINSVARDGFVKAGLALDKKKGK